MLADSIGPHGHRLLTVKAKLPETIWNEVLTHRVFSRNSSSSRAVPVSRWIEEARSAELRVTPIRWGGNQPGMQPGDELTGDALDLAKRAWAHAASDAAYHAEMLAKRGAHKEIANQVLKPFVHTHAVISATEWMNFFGLRLDKAAKIEIRTLAEQIWRIWNESDPEPMRPGEWHLPFIAEHDVFDHMGRVARTQEMLCKVAVSRCARVSYESHTTRRRSTIDEDLALHDRLAAEGHWSPFEHVATPDYQAESDGPEFALDYDGWAHAEQHGNFVGWRQYRKIRGGEAVRPLPEEYR